MLFKEVIGHQALKERLIANIRENRVAHAQLFLGPRGSGNLPLALAYAHYLLCENRGPMDSCGSCTSCVQAARLEHPDLHLMFPIFLADKKPKTCDHLTADLRQAIKEEPYLDVDLWRERIGSENKQLIIGIDIAREIQHKLALRSFRGGHKIMVIWLPQFMNKEAANNLLKILEEPEPSTLFLLVTDDAEHLLPTIISRAQLIKVPAIAAADVAMELLRRFPDLSAGDAQMIGLRCDGDLLEAVQMAEKGEEQLFELFRGWLLACFQRDVVEANEYTEQFQKLGREKQKSFIRYGLKMIRQCVLQWQQVPQLVRAMGREQEFVRKFSKLLTDHNADRIRQELEQAHLHIERNANPRIMFMDMSYRIMGLLKIRA